MSRYEPNIGGAVDILIDIMTANGFTLTRQPYDHNFGGLVEALIDLKKTVSLPSHQNVLVSMRQLLKPCLMVMLFTCVRLTAR